MSEKEKKAKAPSKKELMREIENLDTNKVFDLVSLNRTNIANINCYKNSERVYKSRGQGLELAPTFIWEK